jgi:hypothetical protein
MEASECVRIALQKHGSWKQPFFCIKADVRKAFDSLNHDVIRDCLEKDGTPPQIVHAILSSLVYCSASFSLQNVSSSCDVLLNSGGKQGASETPAIWVRVLDTAWKAAVAEWGHRDLGLHLDTPAYPRQRVFGCYWADDMYIFARGENDAYQMFNILSAEIHKLHLSWKPSALEVLSNIEREPDDVYTHYR